MSVLNMRVFLKINLRGLEDSGHQASVYRTSSSCKAGNRFFRASNVRADSFVLFRFSFLRLVNAATKINRLN